MIVAPLFEEIFFRGFLFRGIANSWLGAPGAIVITAAVWALIHLQYSWTDIGMIFLLGLFLGYARYRTGSTTLTVLLHALWNTASTAYVLIVMQEPM